MHSTMSSHTHTDIHCCARAGTHAGSDTLLRGTTAIHKISHLTARMPAIPKAICSLNDPQLLMNVLLHFIFPMHC